jgi:polyhydroxyalkanoate synthesis regulator phasin
MSDDRERPMDAGDAVREGVRSITGILGALKEAIEDTFDELRGTHPSPNGEKAKDDDADRAQQEEDAARADNAEKQTRSAFDRAQDAVEEMKDRFDFVTRKEFDALRREVDELKARTDASGGGGAGASQATTPADPPPDRHASSMGEEKPEGESGTRFRFEVE